MKKNDRDFFLKSKGEGFLVGLHGDVSHAFIAGGGDRVPMGQGGFALHSGIVQFRDGRYAYALLNICERDSGEFYGATILMPNGTVVHQNDLALVLGCPAEDIFPYRYKSFTPFGGDIHTGADGWSSKPSDLQAKVPVPEGRV
jgi:hypothetical protein